MRIKFLLACALACIFFTSVRAQQIEGLNWWWDAKRSDFIVEGLITYDPDKYYEISAAGLEGSEKKYFWLVGEMKIDRVLFVNKNSEHLEEYELLLKNPAKKHPVLIPAYRATLFSTGAKTTPRLRPLLGIDITKEPTILNLTQVTIYPILNLTVESLVPVENMNQAREIVAKRENNLLAR